MELVLDDELEEVFEELFEDELELVLDEEFELELLAVTTRLSAAAATGAAVAPIGAAWAAVAASAPATRVVAVMNFMVGLRSVPMPSGMDGDPPLPAKGSGATPSS